MSNLLSVLGNSANTLGVLTQALGVVQNNVANANTANFASTRLNLVARPLDITSGLAGGVASQGLVSARDSYADSEVQRQLQTLGYYSAQNQATNNIQNYFDVTGTSGVPGTLTQLFTAFSAWSAAPGDANLRQSVIAAGAAVAKAVNGLDAQLSTAGASLNDRITATVVQVNSLADQIRQLNVRVLAGQPSDPASDAILETSLESLSQLANVSAIKQSDGTTTVVTSNGSPLVIGNQAYNLQASTDAVSARVLDISNKDISVYLTGGQLGGLLDTRNRVIGSIIGNATNTGTLNQFAAGLADSVNNILTSGTVSTAAGAANGPPLFTYTAGSTAAATFAVNSTITPDQLAAVDSAGNVNGNAIQLANLADPKNPAGQLAGTGLLAYVANIASQVGRESQTAHTNEQVQTQVAAQARTLRDQISGVSLDAQATAVLEFQRSYQAVSRVLTIVNSIADSALSIIPQ